MNERLRAYVHTVANASRHFLRVQEGFFVAPTLPGFVRILDASLELRTAVIGNENRTPAEFAFAVYLGVLRCLSGMQMLHGAIERRLRDWVDAN